MQSPQKACVTLLDEDYKPVIQLGRAVERLDQVENLRGKPDEWRDGEFVPRLMLPLSFSYDHRVIDGASAARFVVYLGGLLAVAVFAYGIWRHYALWRAGAFRVS